MWDLHMGNISRASITEEVTVHNSWTWRNRRSWKVKRTKEKVERSRSQRSSRRWRYKRSRRSKEKDVNNRIEGSRRSKRIEGSWRCLRIGRIGVLGVGAPKSKVGALTRQGWCPGGWSLTKSPNWCLVTGWSPIYIVLDLLERLY